MKKRVRRTKYAFYLEGELLDAMRAEAEATGETISMVARRYVLAGLPKVRELPSVEKVA